MKTIQRILLAIGITMFICVGSYLAGDLARGQVSQRGGPASGGGGGGGGTVFVQNTAGIVIASALATIPVAANVNVGTVTAFIANTPGVVPFQAAALSQATSTATTLPNVQTTAITELPVLNLGYDSTASNNAYRAMSVDASGFLNANVKNSPGVNVQGTIGVAVQNTPAVQGSVSLNNTPGVLVQGTIGVAIQNTPGVIPFQAAALAQATTTATTLPNVQTTAVTELPVLNLGYDSTASNNAYRAMSVDASGFLNANVKNSPGVNVQGTIGVSVQNTPAVQGSVSINNTPAVIALQAAALAQATTTATTLPNVQTTASTELPVLALGYDSTASNNAYRALSVNSSGALNVTGASGGGTVFVNNTPAVIALQAAALNQATTTATTLPNVQTTASTELPVLAMGYDSTASNNAYRALSVNASGALNVTGASGGGTVFVNNTPAIVGSVSINNTPAVLIQGSPGVVPFQAAGLAQSTQTATLLPNVQTTPGTELPVLALGYDNTDTTHNAYRALSVDSSGFAKVNIASAIATVPVSVPTIGVAVNATLGVQVFNTPGVAVQGTIGVAIQNTPAIQGAAALEQVTTTATLLPNVQVTPGTLFPDLNMGLVNIDTTHNAYQAIRVDNAGAQYILTTQTAAIQGSVSINNTPAIQGSVSLNNTPAVLIQGTPAIQGSVSINNTPAIQGAAALEQVTTTATLLPNVEVTPGTLFPNLAMGLVNIDTTHNAYQAIRVDNAGAQYILTTQTAAIQGSVSINNTVSIATPTYNVQAFPGATMPVTVPTGDPCNDPNTVESFVAINNNTATASTTPQLIAASGGTSIYICGYAVTIGSPGSWQINVASTATAQLCVSPTPITGLYTGGVSSGFNKTIAKSAGGQQLCLGIAGASANVQGVLGYVQK